MSRAPIQLLIATIVFSVGLAAAAAAQTSSQTLVRQSLQEFVKDRGKVDKLIAAIGKMRSRDRADKTTAEYRTSWEYWAAIHGYPGTGSPSGGTVEELKERVRQRAPQAAPLFAGFFNGLENMNPPDALAKDTWATMRAWYAPLPVVCRFLGRLHDGAIHVL